jgi:hypothetical protein
MRTAITNVDIGPAETLSDLERQLEAHDKRMAEVKAELARLTDQRRRLWDRVRYRRGLHPSRRRR